MLPYVYIICGLISYLLGAIPFGLIITKAKGIDIRKVGSGNIGATNVLRALGKKWGIITLICDALKGFISAYIIPAVAARFIDVNPIVPVPLAVTCAAMAVVGHNWPVYIGFKGGKGIATSAGALLGLAWQAIAIGFSVWICAFLLMRYVSLASIIAAASIGISSWFIYANDSTILRPIALTLLAVLAIWRHKPNIKRLLNGSESKFNFKKRK